MLSFILGGLIGTCIGLLYAPKKGIELRKKLQVLLEDFGDKAEDWIEDNKDKVEDIVVKKKQKTGIRNKDLK